MPTSRKPQRRVMRPRLTIHARSLIVGEINDANAAYPIQLRDTASNGRINCSLFEAKRALRFLERAVVYLEARKVRR